LIDVALLHGVWEKQLLKKIDEFVFPCLMCLVSRLIYELWVLQLSDKDKASLVLNPI